MCVLQLYAVVVMQPSMVCLATIVSFTIQNTTYSFHSYIPQLEIPLSGDVHHRTVLSLAAGSGSRETFSAVLDALKEDLTADKVGTGNLPSGDLFSHEMLTVCKTDVVTPATFQPILYIKKIQ